MTKMALVAAAAAMGTLGWARSADVKSDRTVAVCFEKASGDVADNAEMIASRMFLNIGVKLEWRERRICQAENVIVISLSTHTPHNLLPGALAYALPYEGVHIEVFYDRMAQANANVLPYILAHVLVHEITHILQGVNQHSERGIMKAHWDTDDFSHMDTKPLVFIGADIDLIYKGLAARATANATPRLLAAR